MKKEITIKDPKTKKVVKISKTVWVPKYPYCPFRAWARKAIVGLGAYDLINPENSVLQPTGKLLRIVEKR